jgi:hypothetical protein
MNTGPNTHEKRLSMVVYVVAQIVQNIRFVHKIRSQVRSVNIETHQQYRQQNGETDQCLTCECQT